MRWSEVDAQKIVFNAHYLMYADVAVTDYWRQMAMPYVQSWATLGGELFVKKATVTYHASAQMGDVLDVGIRCVKQGNTSLQFEAGIFRGQQLLNTVELVYVFADAQQQPQPVPQALRDMLTAFEAGEDMVQLRSGNWNDLGRLAEPQTAEMGWLRDMDATTRTLKVGPTMLAALRERPTACAACS